MDDLVPRGVVQEVQSEPCVVHYFLSNKKDVYRLVILGSRALNSCVPLDQFQALNMDFGFANVRSFQIGSSLDRKDASFQVRLTP